MNGTDTDGDGVPDLWGTCLDMTPYCKISFNAAAILAPYVQYGGTADGMYLDPDPPGGGGLTSLVGGRSRYWASRDSAQWFCKIVRNYSSSAASLQLGKGTVLQRL
jgi:hypothetical protein